MGDIWGALSDTGSGSFQYDWRIIYAGTGKKKDISVLHALGGNKSFIQRIFLSEGMLLALIGGGIGMLLALLIAWLQIRFHLIRFGRRFFFD